MMMSSGRSVDLSVSISHAPDDTVSAAAVDKLTDEYFLGKLCKHIPRMLRHQLISKLVNQYIFREKNQSHQLSTVQETASVRNTAGDAGVDFQANTSIYRFHGTLLFVDISGFTVLSQKLKVDDLKNQINAYFQKIVDIINKYDGEIIKFAGDALFIIWQTKVNTTEDPNFLKAAKEATDNAVKCGIEINIECGNYPIALRGKPKRNPTKFTPMVTVKDEVMYSDTGNAELARGIMDLAMNSHSGEYKNNDDNNNNNNEGITPSAPLDSPTKGGLRVNIEGPASPMHGNLKRGMSTFNRKQKNSKRKKEAQVTYLNIHAGVSVGVMAGMDVGAKDRFEYMLLGQPMSDVAVAEADAEKGEIVVSPAVHSLIHDFGTVESHTALKNMSTKSARMPESRNSSDKSGASRRGSKGKLEPLTNPNHTTVLPCGCVKMPSGNFRIPKAMEETFTSDFGSDLPHKASRGGPPLSGDSQQHSAELNFENELYSQVIDELMSGYKSIGTHLQTQFSSMLRRNDLAVAGMSAKDNAIADNADLSESTKYQLMSVVNSIASPQTAIAEHSQKEVLMEQFFTWSMHCLLDDIAKHAHEVVRRGFAFHQESRASPFDNFLNSPAALEAYHRELERVTGIKPGESRNLSINSPPSSSVHSPRGGSVDGSVVRGHRNSRNGKETRDSFVNKIRQLNDQSSVRERKQDQHEQVLKKDGALVSELRNVTVLFISVKLDHATVMLDPIRDRKEGVVGVRKIQTCKVDSFHFLARTVEEIEADKKLINQFQSCMEVVTEVFHSKGGQLRQFIVDDKGTVCIGTFGLRGSVNYDNAASAIDAADSIVARLQALGFNASVGVTSGAAYCGLVGSNTRHEYAVMGPSTNLSARLMGRAAEGEIICDSAIRQRDRAHTYASLGAVKAKGYANPVPIFKPQFGTDVKPRVTMKFMRSMSSINTSSKVVKTLAHGNGTSESHVDVSTEVFGRKNDGLAIFKFLFSDTLKGDLDELSHTFWKPTVHESPTKLEDLAHTLAPFDFTALRGESKNKHSGVRQDPQKCRFDTSKLTKLAFIVAPNGMGKTLMLDLFQLKLNMLVIKDRRFYNIAVFRHHVGYINSTTLFSAWYSQVRQTLFSIAETIAESGDANAVRCVHALNVDDFSPIIDFLSDYLPPELRPFTSLLSLVGVKFTHKTDRNPITPIQERKEEDMQEDTPSYKDVGGEALYGEEIQDDSGKADPVDALDPAERLQRCAELIVAIAQLHVDITRKITIYLMDDLQYYDPVSQDLQRLLFKGTHGICLICTYRASGLEITSPTSAPTVPSAAGSQSAAQFAALAKAQNSSRALIVEGNGISGLNAALYNNPNSNVFLRVSLQPITKEASQRLFTKILNDYGIKTIEDIVFEKLHSLSGGSPLYATELAKGICERYIHRECDSTEAQNTSLCNLNLVAIIDDLRTDRIEEMVHFRFDKLTEQCQLVLKMAAVAAVNGSHFTFAMLGWVLDANDTNESNKFDSKIFHTAEEYGQMTENNNPDEEGSVGGASWAGGSIEGSLTGSVEGYMDSSKGVWNTYTMNLVQALNDLLEAEEFIEFRETPTTSARSAAGENAAMWLYSGSSSKSQAKLNVESESPHNSPKHLAGIAEGNNESENDTNDAGGFDRFTLHKLRFFWKVDLELRAIYDLMLDEQKESLHDRVASYLEKEFSDGRIVSATEWWELGFHWERATSWSSAMTCYFNSGMLLKEQGDTLGCKAHFTSAFRMLDKMRHEVGQKTAAPTATPTANDKVATPVNVPGVTTTAQSQQFQNHPNKELLGLLHALGGRQSGLTVADLFKLYEGDAYLLHVGFSLIIRVAQGLIGFNDSALSIELFEEAMEIMQVLMTNPRPLRAADGLPFELRNKEIMFAVLSGMFLLLLTGQAKDDALHSRIQATVAVSIMIARSRPEYEVHLVMALASKLKMLDLFQAVNPAVTPGIIATADDMMSLYDPEIHSADLVYFYNSDRAGNAFGVVLKTMCMKGHFKDNIKYLDRAKRNAIKMRHFYSLSLGILVLFPMLMMYHSDAQAQVLYKKYRKTEAKQQNNDFRDGVAIWMEWSSQVHNFEKMKVKFDENIYKDESVMVDRIIQMKLFVQDKQPHFYLNLIRLHCIGVEFAIANICYLKALKFELYSVHYKTPEVFRDKIKHYLQLALTHITFTPAQTAMNQMFLFSNLHEKLLRAQILMKVITYSDNVTEAHAAWTAALENLGYCAAVGQRNDFQAILLQAGILMQALANLPFPAFPAPIAPADGAQTEATEGALTGTADPAPAATTTVPSEQTQPAPLAEKEGAPTLAEDPSPVVPTPPNELTATEVMQRAGLRAQGAALQAHALQYLKQVNGEEVVEELLKRKINVQMPNIVDFMVS